MRVESADLVAGERTPFHIPGRFFLLVEAGAPLNVELRRNGSLLRERAENVVAGYKAFPGDWADPDDNTFDEFVLTSASAQTIQFGVSASAGDYSFLLALVQLRQPKTWDNGADTSLNTGTTVILPDANRLRIHVQNVGASGVIRIGNIVTAVAGLRLHPGDTFVSDTEGLVNMRMEVGTGSAAILEELK